MEVEFNTVCGKGSVEWGKTTYKSTVTSTCNEVHSSNEVSELCISKQVNYISFQIPPKTYVVCRNKFVTILPKGYTS